MLQATVVTSTAEFAAMHDEWSNLVERSCTATIFDTFDWMWTWWDQIGKRNLASRLHIIALRNEMGDLRGIAPFYSTISFLPPARKLKFLGSGISDYHDLIAAKGSEGEVVSVISTKLSVSLEWDVADLNQLREEGVLRSHFDPENTTLHLAFLAGEACPFVDIPASQNGESSWEMLLGSYSKKMRGNIRYYDRALDRVYTVERELADTNIKVKEALEALYMLHQRRWNKRFLPGVFYSKIIQRFHSKVALRLLAAGQLRLHMLRLDGSIEAVLYCLRYKEITCYYQGGFEPSLSKLSLGSVLTGLALKTACDQGDKIFDFLRGEEEYKKKWTKGDSKRNTRLLLGRRGFILYTSFKSIVRAAQMIERVVKERLNRPQRMST